MHLAGYDLVAANGSVPGHRAARTFTALADIAGLVKTCRLCFLTL